MDTTRICVVEGILASLPPVASRIKNMAIFTYKTN